MRETSFGRMALRYAPWPLSDAFEVMHFERAGRSHTHDNEELAICVTGAGVVVVNGEATRVEPGTHVVIPAGAPHHMEPDEQGMAMVIAYRDTTPIHKAAEVPDAP